MDVLTLPGTSLSVSRLGFGCSQLMARMNRRQSVRLLQAAFDAGVTHFDVARDLGAELTIVVNPRVPVSTRGESVPTGHGVGTSVRDKGLLWVMNQSRRIASQAMLDGEEAHPPPGMAVLRIEPHPEDAVLFLRNTRSFEGRRVVLEHAYRTTRARLSAWLANHAAAAALGLRAR